VLFSRIKKKNAPFSGHFASNVSEKNVITSNLKKNLKKNNNRKEICIHMDP